MMFPPFLMSRIGEAVANSKNEDLIRRQEQQVAEWQTYARQLEAEIGSFQEKYRELASQSHELVQYTKNLERDNASLQDMVSDLGRLRDRFRAEADRIRGEMDRLRSQATKLEHGYKSMKGILTKMSENADIIFTAQVTADQREKLARFLDRLPE